MPGIAVSERVLAHLVLCSIAFILRALLLTMPVVTQGALDLFDGAVVSQSKFEEFENNLPDTALTRTILFLRHFGAVVKMLKCPTCKGNVSLTYRNDRYVDKCDKSHHCWEEKIKGYGVFAKVNKSGWPAVLMMIAHMHLDDAWATICHELQSLLGPMTSQTLTDYRRYIQGSIKNYLLDSQMMQVGGTVLPWSVKLSVWGSVDPICLSWCSFWSALVFWGPIGFSVLGLICLLRSQVLFGASRAHFPVVSIFRWSRAVSPLSQFLRDFWTGVPCCSLVDWATVESYACEKLLATPA